MWGLGSPAGRRDASGRAVELLGRWEACGKWVGHSGLGVLCCHALGSFSTIGWGSPWLTHGSCSQLPFPEDRLPLQLFIPSWGAWLTPGFIHWGLLGSGAFSQWLLISPRKSPIYKPPAALSGGWRLVGRSSLTWAGSCVILGGTLGCKPLLPWWQERSSVPSTCSGRCCWLLWWFRAQTLHPWGEFGESVGTSMASGLFLVGCNSLPFLACLARMQQEAGVLLFRVVLFHWPFCPDSSVLTPWS